MENRSEFDDIRPFYDEEVAPVISELLKDPEFQRVIKFIFPTIDWEAFVERMRSFHNKYDFQHTLIKETIFKLLENRSSSARCVGFENVNRNQASTFISNHRDIILDASILCILLSENGFDTTEIAIGDNLLIQPWIEKVVRLNKSFLVKRGVSVRQKLEASLHLSQYMHYTINEKKQSIWIAQREGRAKDSNDKTQESLVKMLSMGGKSDLVSNIRELNITPVSLSYEFDPCDYLKAKEFQLKRDNPEYKKSQQDDLINMETGLTGFKGHIHFQIGKSINPSLDSLDTGNLNKNELIEAVARLIDKEIYLNYHFYPINYIAYDRLTEEKRFTSFYDEKDVEKFEAYLHKQLNQIDLADKDIPFLTGKILEMYAYPVKNQLSVLNP